MGGFENNSDRTARNSGVMGMRRTKLTVEFACVLAFLSCGMCGGGGECSVGSHCQLESRVLLQAACGLAEQACCRGKILQLRGGNGSSDMESGTGGPKGSTEANMVDETGAEEGSGTRRQPEISHKSTHSISAGADATSPSLRSSGAKDQILFFKELRRQAALSTFREPQPEDVIVVPEDEVDVKRAVAVTPNGGCTYFAAIDIPRGRGEKEGCEEGDLEAGETIHAWEDSVDILHGRRIDLVFEKVHVYRKE